MKRLGVGLMALFIAVVFNGCNDNNSSSGISSGTYECSTQFGKVNLYLYPDGKAKTEGSRGFWSKYGDDEATVIKESWVLRYKGDNKYTFRGVNCTKVQ